MPRRSHGAERAGAGKSAKRGPVVLRKFSREVADATSDVASKGGDPGLRHGRTIRRRRRKHLQSGYKGDPRLKAALRIERCCWAGARSGSGCTTGATSGASADAEDAEGDPSASPRVGDADRRTYGRRLVPDLHDAGEGRYGGRSGRARAAPGLRGANLPLARMIGVKRQVNQQLKMAGTHGPRKAWRREISARLSRRTR